ncbi:MAG: M1 family metallopeptidase [Solirubrobacterales bacterium]
MLIPRLSRCLLALALASLVLASAAGAAEKPREPFFPRSGNAGYDARHYDVHLSYRPSNATLRAAATIDAFSTRRLSRFSLDLDGLEVTKVLVDGEPARFNRGRGKLKLRPRTPVARGERFTVAIRYQGRPRKVTDPDGSQEGWYRTDDGALAVGEPVGTAAWLPCNNVPADKASFEISISVPKALKAVSNGRLHAVGVRGRRKTFTWVESEPMSTYLAVVDIGRGKLVRSEPDGLPSWTLVDPRLTRESAPVLAQLPEVIRFESKIYGDYPFAAAGSIVDEAPQLGYALETQARPIYAFAPDLTTLVHETAHQWFGDSVGLKRWPNIWLNEGFATWTEWYYAERHGGQTARQAFRRLYRVPASKTDFWDPPSGHPGTAKNLFATSTYLRGAMTLEALRVEIGTRLTLRLLRRWASGHRHASADIEQFVDLAEEVSGRQLDGLFDRWLYQRGKPRGYGSI